MLTEANAFPIPFEVEWHFCPTRGNKAVWLSVDYEIGKVGLFTRKNTYALTFAEVSFWEVHGRNERFLLS